MADAKLTALTAASALAGADLFYISQGGVSKRATHTQLLTLVGTTYVPLAGGTMTGALTLPAGAVGTPSLMFTGAGATTGVYSDGASNLSFSIGGVRAGFFSSLTLGLDLELILLNNSGSIRFGSATAYDPVLTRAGDGAVCIRTASATMGCSLYVSGLYTDASNYERLSLSTTAGSSVNISAETLGTGGDNLDIVLTPAGTGRVAVGNFLLYPTGVMAMFTNAAAVLWGASGDAGIHRGAAGQLDVTNGTAGTWRDLKLRNLIAGGGNGSYVQTPSMTVANLAAAATAGAGARAFVTDANATTFLSTVAAGGANKVPVVSDGTNWLIG